MKKRPIFIPLMLVREAPIKVGMNKIMLKPYLGVKVGPYNLAVQLYNFKEVISTPNLLAF